MQITERCILAACNGLLPLRVTAAVASRVVAFAAVAFVSACDQPDPTIAGPAVSPAGIGRYVTGDAAARLNARGSSYLQVPALSRAARSFPPNVRENWRSPPFGPGGHR